MHCLTIDLEDWFHFLDLKDNLDVDSWGGYEPHVERMTYGLLDFLDQHQQKATFFVLGWIAKTYPALIKFIASRGHEIACHSFSHPIIHRMTPAAFEADLVTALDYIEIACGSRPTVFRAPGFSITSECLWAFDIIRKNNIKIDSSVFPMSHAHGGLPGAPVEPFVIETKFGDLCELPLTSASFLGGRFVFSGGGYFRLIPGFILNALFRQVSKRGSSAVTYFHPRDFYIDAPLPKLSMYRQFKARVGLSKSFAKLHQLLEREAFGTVSQCVDLLSTMPISRFPAEKLLTSSESIIFDA